MRKKKDRVFGHLIAIPLCLVFDAALICAGSFADGKLFSGADQIGHGAPVFTVIAFAAAVILTLIVVIISVIRTVKALTAKRRER